jgi:hypothetical protein
MAASHGCESWLRVEAFEGAKFVKPALRGLHPDVQLGAKLVTLLEGADAQVDRPLVSTVRLRENAGSAVWTESECPPPPTFGDLREQLELTLNEHERRSQDGNAPAHHAAGVNLAIGAMTKKDAVRIDFRHVAYLPAETSALDLHRRRVLPMRLKA